MTRKQIKRFSNENAHGFLLYPFLHMWLYFQSPIEGRHNVIFKIKQFYLFSISGGVLC